MQRTATIAIAGFQHETNTFAPHLAHYDDFVKADGWPGLTTGERVFSTMSGLNIPISGFIESARAAGHGLKPILWASAEPSGFVTRHAFETIANMICDSLKGFDGLDAVYLDLHGAMVTEHLEDGEGELLYRVRQIIGSDMPLVISLDLHANITRAMVEQADVISVFRTYPHLDMAETGSRAFHQLQFLLDGGTLVGRMKKIPFLFPLSSQCTDFEPCKTIYRMIEQVGENSESHIFADFATGFPNADIYECGAALVAFGETAARVEQELERLYQYIIEVEPLFVSRLYTADEAIQKAMAGQSNKPVVIADAQDNPGAGGTSDTTGLLCALVDNQATEAILGVIYDPEVAALAHRAGQGKIIDTSLGGKSGLRDSPPFQAGFIVESITDGDFTFTGEMYGNSKARLGPMALLRIVDDDCDVRVIVSSERVQCLDQAIFRHLGIEPQQQKILVVKSTVHFRADFDPIAAETLVVASPGASSCRLTSLDYKNLRPGLRLEPGE